MSFNLPEGRRHAVRGISFDLRAGEILGIAGESGSGKSVTCLSLLRLLPRNATVEGSIAIDNADVSALTRRELRDIRSRTARMIFQDPWAAMNPLSTIGTQIRESLHARFDVSKAQTRRAAVDILDRVGIAEPERIVDVYPHEMSGGMLQRVMIAMALVADPSLLICDEPTTALDVTTESQILELLRKINRDTGTAIIITSHDLGVLEEHCDRLLIMYAGRVVESGPASECLANPFHPYTWSLVNADPALAEKGSRLSAIEGMPPDPEENVPGCSFHPRCPFATDICATQVPALLPVRDELSEPSAQRHLAACHFTTGEARKAASHGAGDVR